MKWISMLAVAVLAALIGPALAQGGCGYGTAPPPPNATAEVFLHSIYDRYIGPEDKTHPIDYSKPTELRKYFEPGLVAMIMKDGEAAARRDEVPTLDGDPFVGAQEWDVKAFDIKVTPGADADHAEAVIKFVNYEPKLFHVKLVRIAGQWRIWDVDYGGDAGTLRGMYKDQH